MYFCHLNKIQSTGLLLGIILSRLCSNKICEKNNKSDTTPTKLVKSLTILIEHLTNLIINLVKYLAKSLNESRILIFG